MAQILDFNKEACKLNTVKVSKERLDKVENSFTQSTYSAHVQTDDDKNIRDFLKHCQSIALEESVSLPPLSLNDFELWLEESDVE